MQDVCINKNLYWLIHSFNKNFVGVGPQFVFCIYKMWFHHFQTHEKSWFFWLCLLHILQQRHSNCKMCNFWWLDGETGIQWWFCGLKLRLSVSFVSFWTLDSAFNSPNKNWRVDKGGPRYMKRLELERRGLKGKIFDQNSFWIGFSIKIRCELNALGTKLEISRKTFWHLTCFCKYSQKNLKVSNKILASHSLYSQMAPKQLTYFNPLAFIYHKTTERYLYHINKKLSHACNEFLLYPII